LLLLHLFEHLVGATLFDQLVILPRLAERQPSEEKYQHHQPDNGDIVGLEHDLEELTKTAFFHTFRKVATVRKVVNESQNSGSSLTRPHAGGTKSPAVIGRTRRIHPLPDGLRVLTLSTEEDKRFYR